MNKSTTNRNFSDQPDIGLVSRSELGKRVLVNGHFGGILRYLGPVQGKQGIFFGVELDQPVGKNDGTHQGTFYFECRPGHGIFAPCHKIELEEKSKNEREEMGANQLLSRSAMPSLAMASIPPAKNAVGQPAPMDWSLMSMSTGSTNSAGSLAKFLDEDLMAHSHATYTVFESDCLMLSDLELSDSATLLRFDEEGDEPNCGGIGEEEEWGQRNIGEMRQRRVDESIILEGPTFGGMDLPVIGTPDSLLVDDAPTPMAEENLDFATGLTHWQQRSLEDRRNRNNLGLSGLGQRNGGRGQGELFTAISSPCRDNSPNNNNGGGQREVINGEERRRKGGNKDARNNNNNRAENGTTKCTSPAGEEAVANGGKSREKRPRVSVFQSTPMPSQNLSAAARSKPKQPTKAQLVMEQLKASMEAEKQRPKKEIRSKLQVAREEMEEEKGKRQEGEEESAPTKQMKSQSNIDHSSSRAKKIAEDSKGAEKQQKSAIRNAQISSSTKPKSNMNSPLKRPYATKTSSSSSSKSTPNVIAKSDAVRPRQILTSKENTASSSSKQPTTSASGLLQKMAKSSSNESVASKTSSKIAGFFSKPVTIKKKPKEPTKAEIKQILQKNIESFGLAANRVLSSHLAHQASVADSEIAKLRQLHGQRELENAEKLEQQLANSKLEKADALQKLERSWQSKLNEANGKHEEELDRIRINLSTEHRNELQNVRAQNQKVVDELGERVNSLNGQMAEQAKKYEAKLKESESARNGRLNDELASLQFALQMKNDEIQKLRGENRELIIQTEKIAEKEAQITKFGKKNEELKEEVNRLKQIERSLISQLNEFRRELEETRTKSKEMQMEREVLEYQLQEQIEKGHDSTTPLSTPKMTKYREFSPHSSRLPCVNVRTPEQRQKSADRPNSSCLPSQGRSIELESDMSKSMDSAMSQSVISCYRQEGRSKSQNTPNKIYTPREFYSYEVNDQLPTSARRIVEFEDCSGGRDDVAAPDTTTLLDSETK